MQTSNKMAVAPVGKLIWQMSIPPLISMFLQYSYNLIDSAFVARLSENALTAVSLSFTDAVPLPQLRQRIFPFQIVCVMKTSGTVGV